jgi:radical SAM-linked protein
MTTQAAVPEATMTANSDQRFRYRLRYEKTGDLAWVGHQDLMHLLDRLFRRADLPVAFSEGFNPRPKVSLVQALGLGIEALREVMELELTRHVPGSELLERLNAKVPPGLSFRSVEDAPGRRAARAVAVTYLSTASIPDGTREAVSLRMEELLEADTWPIERHRNQKVVSLDLRPLIHSLDWSEDGYVRMCLRVTPEATLRPEEVLAALGLERIDTIGALIRLDLILEEHASSAGSAPTHGT